MRIKLFQATGYDRIEGLEERVNDWIEQPTRRIDTIKTCANSVEIDGGVMVPHVVICISYHEV